MKHKYAILFLLLLIFLFFSKAIFSKNKVFAPVDEIYMFQPWNEYNHLIPQNFQQTDALFQFIPWRWYYYQQMRIGNFPLWNPYEFGGIPFFANDQSAVLSPYNLLSLFFPFKSGFLIIAILKLIAASTGMYFFLNLFSLNKPSLIVGSIAYTFSALIITWLYSTTSSVLTLMPWLFWSGERLLRYAATSDKRNAFLSVLILALITAVSFFCGHSETTTNVLLGFMIYACTKIFLNKKKIIQTIFIIIVGIAMGLLLASIQIIPFLQLLLNSEPFYARSFMFPNYPFAMGTHIPWYALILWFVPNIIGNPSFNYFYSSLHIIKSMYLHEAVSYIGIAPLLLSFLTIKYIKIDYKRLLPFWITLLFGFVMAYNIPGFLWLSGLPFIRGGVGARYIFLMAFSFSSLSAFGLNNIINEPDDKSTYTMNKDNKMAMKVVTGISIISIILYLITRDYISLIAPLFGSIKSGETLSWYASERLIFIIIQILLAILFLIGSLWLIISAQRKRINIKIFSASIITLSIIDLFIFGIGYNPVVAEKDFYPAVPIINKLKEFNTKDYTFFAQDNIIPPNISIAYNLRDFGGYDIIVSNRCQNFFRILFPQETVLLGLYGESKYYKFPNPIIASIAGIKYFIFPKEIDPNQQGVYFKLIGTYNSLSLWDNTQAKPIIYAASRVIPEDNDLYALQLLSNATVKDIGSAIVYGADTYQEYNPYKISLETIENEPGKHVIMVNAKSDGFLVMNEPIYPGWHAYIDNKPVKIYPTNYLFQGIKLNPGNYKVTFKYMPEAFVIGLCITIATAIFIVISGVIIGIKILRRTPS